MAAARRAFLQVVGGALALAAVPGRGSAEETGPLFVGGAPGPAAEILGEPSSADRDLTMVNIESLEDAARQVVGAARLSFLGPAGDGWTYRENRRAFGDFPIMPHRLRAIPAEAIDQRVTLLGHELPLPIITCPVGSQGMIHATAELSTAGGTGMAGSLYVMSGAANQTMEAVAGATSGPKWFQIYMNRDMGINRWLVQRAKAAGFTAIVLTADALGPGQSDDYIKFGRPRPAIWGSGNHDPARGGRGNFEDQKRDLSYDDIGFLHEAAGLPVVVKGLLRPEDVGQAIGAGAAGIWVSNHGGRQMDGVPASITALRPAVDVVAGRVPVILDSGVRRGIDVVKALAIGANVVAIGRPAMWASAVGGPHGVKSAYAQFAAELRQAMMLTGVAKVTDLNRSSVVLKNEA
jgi:lactate oxidase